MLVVGEGSTFGKVFGVLTAILGTSTRKHNKDVTADQIDMCARAISGTSTPEEVAANGFRGSWSTELKVAVCTLAAAGASNFCPQLLALVTRTTCPEWASVDSPTIALGSQAIGLAITVPAGVTPVDYCLSVSTNNLGAEANVAACNSVPQATF